MNARGQILNVFLSLLWTIIFVGPVCAFCVLHLSVANIYGLSAVGLLTMFVPKALMERLALSCDGALYRRLRVPLLVQLTQDAGWVRRIVGTSEPRARRDRKALARIAADTWFRERFHLGLLISFFLCAVAACLQGRVFWCLALLIANILYNLYPIWLQQYLRLRVARCLERASSMRFESLAPAEPA